MKKFLCLLMLLSHSALASKVTLPPPSDDYYGIYLNGQKVGWLRTQTQVGKTVVLLTDLTAQVTGMGQVSQIHLNEKRTYNAADGALTAIAFEQSAATGSVKVEGVRQGQDLALVVTSAGAPHHQTIKAKETLTDALAAMRLAQGGKVGSTATAEHFDPSLLKSTKVNYTVLQRQSKVFAGVSSEAIEVEARYPELNLHEASWLDQKGRVLESRIGGFFVARLEAEDVAKKLDYQADLLVSAVVKGPTPIAHPKEARQVTLLLQGFSDGLPPTSPRQAVTKQDGGVQIVLTRDPELPALPIGANAGAAPEWLAPTPFIQSDAPEIIAAARKAAGDAKDTATAVSRLTRFVYDHVQDEYVPAYSNALEALRTARGDCTEHSVLFVGLARALKIPARVAVGIAYWTPAAGFGWHAWDEVFLGGRWYTVDPTWNQPIADATHIKLADGDPAQQARIVMLLGQLSINKMQVQ